MGNIYLAFYYFESFVARDSSALPGFIRRDPSVRALLACLPLLLLKAAFIQGLFSVEASVPSCSGPWGNGNAHTSDGRAFWDSLLQPVTRILGGRE